MIGVAVAAFAIALVISWPRAGAQVQEVRENHGAAAAYRALLRLRSTATVLQTTAHPDGEDGALLAWLSRGRGVRTGLLTLNRGEGGANLIGTELYDALGLLRTEELLAAGRYYGVDQFFTRVTDFGFSKRLDETLEHWGKELVLGDVVRVIRSYRPDIIISRFHGQARDGHGNHQAAGLLTIEAFRAAADPTRFPEQRLRPWQASKLYLSVRESEPSTLKIDVGDYDPLLGRSYRELAREGLAHQRSQGAGQVRPAPGTNLSHLRLIESVTPKSQPERDLFDGLETSLPALAAGSLELRPQLLEISGQIDTAIEKFDARQPWAIVPELTAGLRKLRDLSGRVGLSALDAAMKDRVAFLLANKEREFVSAINEALGMTIEVLVDPAGKAEGPFSSFQPRPTFTVAIPGQKFTLTATAVNRGRAKVAPTRFELITPRGWRATILGSEAAALDFNQRARARFEVSVPADAALSRPYFTRRDELREYVYRLEDANLFGLPAAPPEIVGRLTYEVNGVTCAIERPAQTTYVDRARGEQRRLLVVAPALSITLSPAVGVIPIGPAQTNYVAQVSLLNNVKGEASGRLRLRAPAGWAVTPPEATFQFRHEGEVREFSFRVAAPGVEPGATYRVEAIAEYNGREYVEGYRVISHPDLEPRHLYRPAVTELRAIEVKVAPGLRVGYIMGVGDEMPKALAQIGVNVQLLTAEDLATGNLDRFDAVVVGIRATAVRSDLKAYSSRLLDYAERGGHLIYQYQTQEFDDAPYGPFPYQLTARAEEVSEEEARVKILVPDHPLLQWPNRITEADFAGWVEERGSKWMSQWDERYTPLFESNDRGQMPQRGGMLTARYGRGVFTYAAYAFYRQMPAGVAGAYRLFANLISLRRRPG
jgi:LmbE family N-acetylglucosaminyl deacetylase